MVDYCKMWKDLNMDLETPDQLCKCCPKPLERYIFYRKTNSENIVLNIHSIIDKHA